MRGLDLSLTQKSECGGREELIHSCSGLLRSTAGERNGHDRAASRSLRVKALHFEWKRSFCVWSMENMPIRASNA